MRDGILTAAVAGGIMLVAGFFAGGGSVNELTGPVGLSPAHSFCHDDWKDASEEADHAIVLKCERGDWITILHEGGSFSHCFNKTAAPVVFRRNPAECPGW